MRRRLRRIDRDCGFPEPLGDFVGFDAIAGAPQLKPFRHADLRIQMYPVRSCV